MATPTLGLDVGQIVSVNVFISPLAAANRSFGSLLIVGDSDVIDTHERIRRYDTIEAVGMDFGASAPEYRAAAMYYSQRPRPSQLYIGRWATKPTHGILRGGMLDLYQRDIMRWQAITDGGFDIDIDGVTVTLSGLNFVMCQTLNSVAAIINTSLGTKATCVWDAVQNRFVVTSSSTGATSTVSFARGQSTGGQLLTQSGQGLITQNNSNIVLYSATGTNIADMLGLSSTTAYAPINGRAPESPVECALTFMDVSADWYGLYFAAEKSIADSEHIAIAEAIEAGTISRIYGISTQNKSVLLSTVADDLASKLRDLSYQRTFVEYSATARFAACAVFGRAFSVNFSGSNTTITLMFKEQVGVVSERLTAQEAATLKAKNCNVFALYNNGKSILQHGKMSGGWWFDERHGLDWLQNDMQTRVFNLLYTSKGKVPQTEQGISQISAQLVASLHQGTTNGLIAPGVWNADGFGQIERGDMLSTGYYVYRQPLADQPQSEREQRIAPLFQVAVKLAGAVHHADVIVNVNR